MIRQMIRTMAIGTGLLAAVFVYDAVNEGPSPVRVAEARIGRPLTPLSVAGVARRTTRRTIRRRAVYAATLPVGCVTTVTINGVLLHHCGGAYYQPYGTQYVLVDVY